MITSKERAYLRGLANSIPAIMQIGKGGVGENLVSGILEHVTDIVRHIGNELILNLFAADADAAGGGLDLAGDQLQNRGLAGAGGSHQESELAILDLHGHASQRGVARGIGFYNIGKFNHIYRSKIGVTEL